MPKLNEKIVRPMNRRMKQLVLEMNFGCEAEIFASDLRFKMYEDQSSEIYRGNKPEKNEDLMQTLKSRLNNIIELYQNHFSDLHNEIQLM